MRLLLLISAGCLDEAVSNPPATADTGTLALTTPPFTATTTPDVGPVGPTRVISATVSCDVLDTVRFFVETEGWTGGGLVYSQETGNPPPNWSDTHDLDSVAFDTGGAWDHLEQVLATGAEEATWQPNVSTVFSCDHHFGAGVMTYVFGVNDANGMLADCIAFGQNVPGLISGLIERVNPPGFDVVGCGPGAWAL